MFNIRRPLSLDEINTWLLKITCIFWLFAKLIGWRVWTTYRLFPTAPIAERLDHIPPAVHLILFLLQILFIIALLFPIKNKIVLIGLLAVEIFSCLLDQSRLQPYEYQYIFIVFIFLVNTNSPKFIPAAVIFILAATYFYSGLHKLNEGFIQLMWTKAILRSFLKLPPAIAGARWLYYSGYLAGIIESAAGLGLLFPKTQKTAATVLILMHLFILVLLGPLGLRYNRIVWPWNAAMILYLYTLFLRRNEDTFVLGTIFSGWNKLVFIAWGVLPALNFIGCWDNYLSSSIYSEKLPNMAICISDTAKCRQLRGFFQYNSLNYCNGRAMINIQHWALTEMNSAPYGEIRVYKILQKKLETEYPAAGLGYRYIENAKH
ncbi:MAG TPA: hypothetical protein VNW95_05150 [Mucilaginibacter sp.]|jgi:hypothetical protein|nr:hypothetical protein [Mucilaginibacter sp.]